MKLSGTKAVCEKAENKLVIKETYPKMTRGDMVRFLAEKNIVEPADTEVPQAWVHIPEQLVYRDGVCV